jgi:hypothetical protein
LIILFRSVALDKSLCSLGQDTFIDYLIAFTGLWPDKSLHFFMLCSLGYDTFNRFYHGFNAD